MKFKIGDKSNDYTLIEIIEQKIFHPNRNTYYNRIFYKCKCKCGKENIMYPSRFKSKKIKHCNSCSNRISRNKGKGTGIEDISGQFICDIKKCARYRKLEYLISNEYIWNLFLKQKGLCALSGIPIDFSKDYKEVNNKKLLIRSSCTASLDRIDSRFGYIEGNVQWVHKYINVMKQSLPNNLFIQMCHIISSFNKDNFEPSLVNETFGITRKVQRLTSEVFHTNKLDTSIRHPKKDEDIVRSE